MNIPIKKHTKVRRPVSRYITYIMLGTYNVPFDLEGNSPLTLVQDIRKLENPLQTDSFEREYQKRSRYFAELNIKNWPKEQKGDWNETLKDMSEGEMNKAEKNSLAVAVIAIIVLILFGGWLILTLQKLNDDVVCQQPLDQLSRADYQFCLSKELR